MVIIQRSDKLRPR